MTAALDRAWRQWVDAAERDWSRQLTWPDDVAPHVTENGAWERLPVDERSEWLPDGRYEHGNWTAGFAIGVASLLELGGAATGGPEAIARRRATLAGRAEDPTTHDLGFLFWPSFAFPEAAGQLNGDGSDPAMRAAAMLARRFNAAGGYLQAFGSVGDVRSAGTSTIDTMMNLPLLWWASNRSGNTELFDRARRHARTAARTCLRPDGSTYHLLRFDPLSGALAWRGTFQGATDTSTWSRGQSWAMCGFAWAYAACGEPELLVAADRAAAVFWDLLPADGVPPWDFSDSDPDAPRDSSAAVVAALGALILANTHPDAAQREQYQRSAGELLIRVTSACLNRDPEVEGVLLHSCYSKPAGLGVDGAVGWGEFYTGLALAFASGQLDPAVVLGFEPGAHRLAGHDNGGA